MTFPSSSCLRVQKRGVLDGVAASVLAATSVGASLAGHSRFSTTPWALRTSRIFSTTHSSGLLHRRTVVSATASFFARIHALTVAMRSSATKKSMPVRPSVAITGCPSSPSESGTATRAASARCAYITASGCSRSSASAARRLVLASFCVSLAPAAEPASVSFPVFMVRQDIGDPAGPCERRPGVSTHEHGVQAPAHHRRERVGALSAQARR